MPTCSGVSDVKEKKKGKVVVLEDNEVLLFVFLIVWVSAGGGQYFLCECLPPYVQTLCLPLTETDAAATPRETGL